MNRKETIHDLLKKISIEILEFIKEHESSFRDRWVPQKYINDKLSLKFIAVPRVNAGQRETAWLFSIIARMLEDDNLIEFKKDGGSFYRSKKDATQ